VKLYLFVFELSLLKSMLGVWICITQHIPLKQRKQNNSTAYNIY